MSWTAEHETLTRIADLVHQERPDWDTTVVFLVLSSHAGSVDGTDLAIAALRAAKNRDLPKPAAIGWKGPHWDALDTAPAGHHSGPRCDVCGKREPECYGQRPGRDDDHAFTPRAVAS